MNRKLVRGRKPDRSKKREEFVAENVAQYVNFLARHLNCRPANRGDALIRPAQVHQNWKYLTAKDKQIVPA